MAQIFVSYSRHDSEFVDKLIAGLEKLGYSVWVDRESIVGGDAWMASITEGIKQCQVYLIVLSPNSVASDNVARELMMSFEKKKFILPLRYMPYVLPSTMEFQLTGTEYLDFYEQDAGSATQRLVRALTQHGIHPEPSPLPIDSKTRPTVSASVNLKKIIQGTWVVREIQQNSEFKTLGRITIIPMGQYVSTVPIPSIGFSGKWHVESDGHLILQQFSEVSIVFDKISQDELEGVLLGTRQSWRRAKIGDRY